MTDPMPDPCPQQINVASWVLGALDESASAAYGEHVDGCPFCQAEIAKLQMVNDALPLASEQIAPPPALGDRIMAIVSAEAELLRAAGPEADRPPVARRARTRRWSWLTGWRLAPVGLAVLAAGLVIGISLSGQGTSRHVSQAQVTIAGARARLVVQGSRARLQMTGMPIPPDGKVYEVWILRHATKRPLPTDALFTVSSRGAGEVAVPKAVHDGDSVLVTAEPSGGSDAPTSPPVITAQA
jgi:hypothetical protein